ncbi:MAG: lamin tail domain-containing protein, partial [candidate division WOR-3 bacterium]
WADLKTQQFNMAAAAAQESLFFWYRFSVDANNLGPDDTMYVDITNDENNWTNLFKIGQGADTNVWQTARIDLTPFDSYATARIRFHYVDQPNDTLGSFNCNFWLDSVRVLNYGTITVLLNEMFPNPETFDHNTNGIYSDSDEEYVEMFNTTNDVINVTNYSISDADGMNTLSIPDGISIPDSGYILLYASGEFLVSDRNGNTMATGEWGGTWPGLENGGGTLRLFDNSANQLDEKTYTELDVFPDCAIARIPNGSFSWRGNALATPGRFNGATYVSPIAYAFRDMNGDFIPDNIGSLDTITGVVTAPPGVFSSYEAYIQDYTLGVCLFGSFPAPLNLGDSIVATGTIDQFNGKNELTDFNYTVVLTNATVPDPVVINGLQMNTEQYEGCLVSVNISYFEGFLLQENWNYDAWDMMNNWFTVRIDAETNIPGNLAPVDTFTLTGIKGQWATTATPNTGYQLLPRWVDDFSHMYTPIITPIGEVQEPGSDGVSSKFVDSVVTVEGVVTGPNYVFTTGNPSFYIQDTSGGINIYNAEGSSDFELYMDSLGARLQITGTVTEYRGLTEVANGYGVFLGMDTVPDPQQILPNWFLTEGMESFLVELTGVIVTTPYQSGDGYNFDILNGDAGILGRFTSNSGINPQTLISNEKKTFTGIVGQYDPELPYSTGYQLLLRFAEDIADPAYDTVSTEPLIELAGPKTFIPSSGEQAQININSPYDHRLEVDIHDMSGRVVRNLYSGSGGPNTLYWDGKNDVGRPCKAGIYLLNLKAVGPSGRSSYRRLLVVIGTR